MRSFKRWLRPMLAVLVVLGVVPGLIWLDRTLRNEPHPRSIMSGTVTEIARNDAGETALTLQVTSDYWYILPLDEETVCCADPDQKQKISVAEIEVGDFVTGRYRWLDRFRIQWISAS